MSPPPAGAAGTAVPPEVSQGWGRHPIEAAGWDGWILVQLGFSPSLALSTLLAASSGVVVTAGSSVSSVRAVVRVPDSSARGMLDLGSGVGVSMAGCGCVVSSTLASGISWVRHLKMSRLLKVVYGLITHLNSCTHITKWSGSWGAQWVGLFTPILKGLGLSQGAQWLLLAVILTR